MKMKILVFLFTFFTSINCEFWLQILHTNDVHSRFDETDLYGGSCSAEMSTRKKCFGGFARIKRATDLAKEDAKLQGIPSVNLNGGDNFVGTPYYSFYKWKIVAKFIDKLEYDVMTLGNHEFDDGIANLVSYLNDIKTPVVCCNLNLTSERRLDLPILTKSKILTVQGKKIAVLGYLTPDTMRLSRTENLQILPEIEYVRAEARRLKANGVAIIIALGHSGFNFDVRIAEEVEEISVVVGAHSHTLLYTPRDEPPSSESAESTYPTIVTQKSGKIVPVVQAYAYTKYLGKLMVRFGDEGEVLEATGNPQLLDGSIVKDPELVEQIAVWTKAVKEQYGAVQGFSRVPLLKPNFAKGQFESTFGNLFADAIIDYVAELAQQEGFSLWTRAAVAIVGNGGIRANIEREKCIRGITMEDIMTALPFQDEVVQVSVYGGTIQKMLEFSVAEYNANNRVYYMSNFLHVSGLRVVYDFSNTPGSRVESVQILCIECDVPKFEQLNEEHVYYILTMKYIIEVADEGYMIRDEYINKTFLNKKDQDVMIRYLKKNQILYPILDGRITVKGVQSDSSSVCKILPPFFTVIFVFLILYIGKIL